MIFPSNSYQHVQLAQGELGSSVVIFLHSLRILVWRFHVHRVLQRLELGARDILLKPHIEWTFVTLYHYQLLYNIYIYINILQYYNITCHLLYQIILLMWMLVWRFSFVYAHVYTFLDVLTASYLMNNLGIDVLGFLVVVGVVQTDAQIGNSVLVPSSSSSGILGLLPSTSPYDIIDDGPTWVNVHYRETHENTTGLSYGLAPITSWCMRQALLSCSFCQCDYIWYRRQTCTVICRD